MIDKLRNRRAELRLLFSSILLTLLLLEIGARVWLLYIAPPEQFNFYASIVQLQRRYRTELAQFSDAKFLPHRYIGFTTNPNWPEHNSLGFRGEEIELEKPDGVFRIVCMGGSTTYSEGVSDFRESYPYLLQQYLREAGYEQVEVINAGVNAYTSLESLSALQMRVVPLQPDMIIVYHGINDVHARIVWPPEAFKADYSGFRVVTSQRLLRAPWWQYSTLLRLIALRGGWIESHSSLDYQVVTLADTAYYPQLQIQQQQGTYPSGIFREASAMQMLETNTPIYFESNLRSMAVIAQANGAVPLFVTFAYSPLFENEPRVSQPEYQFALGQHQDVVRNLGQTLGVPVFDLAAVMPEDTQYFTDGRHFTFEGNQLRARLIGDYIIESGLLD